MEGFPPAVFRAQGTIFWRKSSTAQGSTTKFQKATSRPWKQMFPLYCFHILSPVLFLPGIISCLCISKPLIYFLMHVSNTWLWQFTFKKESHILAKSNFLSVFSRRKVFMGSSDSQSAGPGLGSLEELHYDFDNDQAHGLRRIWVCPKAPSSQKDYKSNS